MPKELWIIIVIVAALIALYILYLVASNRRFHRMCDPQIEKLRRYEEARRRGTNTVSQGEDIAPMPAPQTYETSPQQTEDYSWDDKKKKP